MDDYALIQNLKARYCAAVDMATQDKSAAHEALLTVFEPDIVADYGLGDLLRGATAMADFMVEAVAGGSIWMLHMIHTPLIELDGDTARGSWTVAARMKRIETGRIDEVIGRYTDRMIRRDDKWRIAELAFARL